MAIAISSHEKKQLLDLLKKHIPNTEIWVYGSRITGKATTSSDLDLVVFANAAQASAVNQLKEALDESNITFRIDLFVWNDIPDNFKETIQKNHLVLVKKST